MVIPCLLFTADARPFAAIVFTNLDTAHNGWVTFEQFLVSMSILTRGSIADKVCWVFNLYDLNGDGFIQPDELLNVVSAVHSLLGTHTEPGLCETTIRCHVQRIFKVGAYFVLSVGLQSVEVCPEVFFIFFFLSIRGKNRLNEGLFVCCLPVYLSACQTVWLSVCLYACMAVYKSVCRYFCLFICLSVFTV